MNSILVTGGAGFIGSHLCEHLLSENYKVICLDNFNDFYDPAMKEQNIFEIKDHPNFTLIRGNILDVELLDNIFSGKYQKLTANHHKLNTNSKQLNANRQQPIAIVHLAALAGVRPSLVSSTKYVEVDIKGTVNLLEMSKEYEINHQSTQPGDVPITYADISKARKMLDYNPRTSIEEGVAKFIKWFKEHMT